MKKKSNRQFLTLECQYCKKFKTLQYPKKICYTTTIRKLLNVNFTLKKYCSLCKKHQIFAKLK